MRPTSPQDGRSRPKKRPVCKEYRFEWSDPANPRRNVPAAAQGRQQYRAAVLSSEASAILRDQLLVELEGLELKDDLDAWTLRAWPMANTLAPADGDKVREAFQDRLTRLQSTLDADISPDRT